MLVADSIALIVSEVRHADSTLSKYQQTTNLILVIVVLGFLAYVNTRTSRLVYMVNIAATLLTVYNLLSQSTEVYNLIISYLSLAIVVIMNGSLLVLMKFLIKEDEEIQSTSSKFSTSGPTYVQEFDEQIRDLNPKRLSRCTIRDKCKYRDIEKITPQTINALKQ